MPRYFSSDLCIVQPSSANLQPHKKLHTFLPTHTMNIVTTSNILWKTLTDGSSLLTISSCELFLLQPFPKKRRKKIICTALECWEPSTLLLHFGGNLCCNDVFLPHSREQTNKKILTWLQETLSISSDPGTSELSVKDSAFSTIQPNWSVLEVEVSPMAGFKWFQDSLSANTVQKQHDV